MLESLLSQRYAKALFELCLELKKLEEVRQDMDLLLDVSKISPDFRHLLRSPVIRSDKKASILRSIFENKVSEVTIKFLNLMAHNRREQFLDEVALQFIKLYKKHKNITTVRLKTAVPISKELREEILKRLRKSTGGSIDLVETIDKGLIGGFVVNIEDQQYDASLLRQIMRLKKEFEKNLYIRDI
jgi:F-type H+-transporting ATPase subunit delta